MSSLRRLPIRGLVCTSVVLAWVGTAAMCLTYLAVGETTAGPDVLRPWWIAAGAVVVMAAASAAIPLVDDRAQRRVEHYVRSGLQERILAADTVLARSELPAAGRIVSTGIDGAARIGALRGGFVASIVAAGTAPLIVLVIVAVAVDRAPAALLLVLVLLAPVAVGGFQQLFRRTSADNRAQSRRLAGEFLEALRGLRTVSLYGRTAEHAAHLAAESEGQRRTVMRLLLGNQVVLLVTDIVFYGGLIGTATAAAVHLGTSGELDAGRALALVLLAVLLTAPIDHIGQFFYIGMTGAAAEKEAAALIGEKPRPVPTSALPGRTGPVGCALRGVDLTYPGREKTLSAVNLEVKAGETVVLTGPSGSGKSTMLALLAGDLRPDIGSVEFDGISSDPRASVAVVHQDTFLFTGSVAGNLRLASPGASDAELWTALERTHLADEIRALPHGLDTEVGEFGTGLSGGQAQRLSLARALLRDAPVLILDEVTSHVDRRSEALIADTLASLAGCKTLVLATHSPGLVALADRTIDIGASL
ncbi:ATP-binding cassette domain-containing protein [Rhodococcus zopfii]|uniref:ATP-binding cassette domain-containing protein n=1 Tax=Rhodococcus zopfii TaxID=43772 RepID=UPI0011112A07|nr:ABC transporter ATP-binding protein [Rhodococcus zopfii]